MSSDFTARLRPVRSESNGSARSSESPARSVVSRILAGAVLEQFARDRGVIADFAPKESTQIAPPSAEGELPMDDGASAANAPSNDEQQSGPAADFRMPLWKRWFDCTAIILTVPLWLPVLLLIMLGIKLSSAGPIFYKQARIGYRGRRFMIFKFRTMKVNVETHVHESYFERLMQADVPMTKLDASGDPRLIRCGRFLRAAGLDELPQLFNVLAGEMSLVGPRPCTVHEFARYLPWQRERVNAPPGMTGYWQVCGKNKTTFSEMIDMDIFYGKNMSLSLDLWILYRTVPAVFGQVVETRAVSLSHNPSASAVRPPVPTSTN